VVVQEDEMKSVFVVLATCLGLLGCGGEGVESGPEELASLEQEVFNGREPHTLGWVFPGVVQYVTPSGGYCSGFVINRNTMLTAAHCIGGNFVPGGPTRTFSTTVYSDDANGNWLCVPLRNDPPLANPCAPFPVRANVHGLYIAGSRFFDIAVIRTTGDRWGAPLNDSATWFRLQTTAPKVGDKFTTLGWGSQSDSDPALDELLWGVLPQTINGVFITHYTSKPERSSSPRGCDGDSGGAVFRSPFDVTPFIAGVHIGTDGEDGPCGEVEDTSVIERVDMAMPWLEELIGACRRYSTTDPTGAAFTYARCW
jgi:hypothetical protein